ncbi:MAG: hypothetical protein GQ570_03690 [Helicobacteraceae bacterium]|nr:hypothetical protein [Helicobacteraceae bacterium]
MNVSKVSYNELNSKTTEELKVIYHHRMELLDELNDDKLNDVSIEDQVTIVHNYMQIKTICLMKGISTCTAGYLV